MRSYETMYIVHPDAAGEAYGEVLAKYKKIVEDLGGNVLKIDEWGERKLAYPILKQTRGRYVLMIFETDAEHIAELERRLRIDDNIMRFQTMRLEDGYEVAPETPQAAAEEPVTEAEEAGE